MPFGNLKLNRLALFAGRFIYLHAARTATVRIAERPMQHPAIVKTAQTLQPRTCNALARRQSTLFFHAHRTQPLLLLEFWAERGENDSEGYRSIR